MIHELWRQGLNGLLKTLRIVGEQLLLHGGQRTRFVHSVIIRKYLLVPLGDTELELRISTVTQGLTESGNGGRANADLFGKLGDRKPGETVRIIQDIRGNFAIGLRHRLCTVLNLEDQFSSLKGVLSARRLRVMKLFHIRSLP